MVNRICIKYRVHRMCINLRKKLTYNPAYTSAYKKSNFCFFRPIFDTQTCFLLLIINTLAYTYSPLLLPQHTHTPLLLLLPTHNPPYLHNYRRKLYSTFGKNIKNNFLLVTLGYSLLLSNIRLHNNFSKGI